ncbi:MAG: response regulator [Melioribacteraceae bacterium]|nr:response regulator [Melioribacteraceae bacterium]
MKGNYDILVIDDEKVVIDSVIKIAQLENYTIDFSFEVNEALEKLKQNEYQLIICDIMLPEIDGFQFINLLQKINEDTPIVMTTGYTTIENAVKSLYLGAIDFIPKPFLLDEMLSLLKRGLKYKSLLNQKRNNSTNNIIVSCPSKYFRLGISCWANIDNDGSVLIGATNFFIKSVEPINKIELLENGEILTQALTCAKIISGEYVHNLYSSLSGRIIDVNKLLIQKPEIIEKDPYFEGWLYRIIPHELDYERQKLIPCGSDR